ncbi:MAG: zf-HC2 domain-containing protein [Candidatus Abyssubacteria bacterium]|nr:zf-HC2 domain-containing protein [Candidatus Abyssubacteria bacterium]
MNCPDAKKLLVDYSEDTLSERKRRAVESHLSGCELCRGELSQIERLKERLSSMEAPEPDEKFWQRFGGKLSRRLEGEEAPSGRRLSWQVGAPLAAVAAAAIVVVLSLLVFSGKDRLPQTGPELVREAPSVGTIQPGDATGYDEFILALADLDIGSNGDMEQETENMFFLIEEDLQSVPDDMVSYDIYEQTIDDYLDDLSPEELEDVYESLASI